jgi:ABC-type transporter lipoprotein component MlaA
LSNASNEGTVNAVRFALDGLDTRASIDRELQTLNATSIDPYVAIRSLYTQTKQSQVQGGSVDLNTLPEFPDEPPSDTSAPVEPPTTDPPQAPALEPTP